MAKPSTQPQKARKLAWLDTQGGPFVLMPAGRVHAWGGLDSAADESDFDRACEIDDYIGVIPLDGGEVLVLGDDPFPTAFLSAPSFGGGYLIRMLWGESEEAALAAVHDVPPGDWTTEGVVFDAEDGHCTMFDAVYAGDSTPTRTSFTLAPGRYAIETADVQPDESMCLLVHRLVPMS